MDRLRRALVLVAVALLLAACSAAPETKPSSEKEAPSASPSARTLHVVGLGDSVMTGYHCDCEGIVTEYADALARRTHDRVDRTNLGVNGLITKDVLADLTGDARTRALVARADVVLVTIGANDLLPQLKRWQEATCEEACYHEPVVQMGRRLSTILTDIDLLRSGRAGTVLVTDYWNVFTDGAPARIMSGAAQVAWSVKVTAAANSAICQAVHHDGDTCVDLVGPFKGDGSRDPTPLLAADGDHPDAAGVKVIVAALLRATPASLP